MADHPLVTGGEPPGDWEHCSVSTSVGITYNLPIGQGFEGVDVPDGEHVEVTLDIHEIDGPVTIWYVVYPPEMIMYNFKENRKVIGSFPTPEAACEYLESWMKDPTPGTGVEQ